MKNVKRILAVLSATAMLMTTSVMSASATMWPEDPIAIMNAKVEDCTVTYNAYDIDDFALYSFTKLGYDANEGDNFATIFTKTLKVYGRFNNGTDHALITYTEKNGKTEFLGATEIISDTIIPDIDDIAKDIKKAQDDEIIDMKIGKSRNAWSYIIYYKTDDGEFVVPIYDIEGSKAGYEVTPYDCFESGKTYMVNEFLEAYNDFLSKDKATDSKYEKYLGLVMGDTDENGKVNVRDCSFAAKTIANKFASVEPNAAWDYNMDEKINVRDCADLANNLANK